MSERVTGKHVNSLANSRAWADFREMYAEEFHRLMHANRLVAEERFERGTKDRAKRVYSYARSLTQTQLCARYPGQWQLLLQGWREHFKKELGWVDLRPQENRSRV